MLFEVFIVLVLAAAPVNDIPAAFPESVMAVEVAFELVSTPFIPSVVTLDTAPAVVTSIPAEAMEKFPPPEKANAPLVCAYPVTPDRAPALIFNPLMDPVVFAVMTPVLVIR